MTQAHRRPHRRLRRTRPLAGLVAVLAASLVVLGQLPATARTDTLGPAPVPSGVRHFQNGPFQRLRWSPVEGATSYQVFVKTAAYDQRLPQPWTLLKTVQDTATFIFVPRGDTREFGVRAVGAPDTTVTPSHHQVTTVSDFGTISRPPKVTSLAGARRWQVVHDPALFRGTALETSVPGHGLRLPRAKQTYAVRLVAETGHRFGTVDVYDGRTLLRTIDLGADRHHARAHFSIRLPNPRGGTIRVVPASTKPVRISAIGQTRARTGTSIEPPAPLAYPAATSFTFTGAGWGHGVGLSQYGAEAMARAGYTTTQILQHYYTGTTVGPRPDAADPNPDLDVNVGLHRRLTTVRLLALQDGASMQVCAIRDGSCAKQAVVHDATADTSTAGRVTLLRFDGKVRARVRDENGQLTRVTGERIQIRWSGTAALDGPAAVVRLGDGLEYRHGELDAYPDGTDRVNDVVQESLEDYLLGVAEMPSSWDPAALQAQAIIARTYALKKVGTIRPSCQCNLYDSSVDQSYTGWGKENEGDGTYGQRWVSAVTSTAGQVVTYDGQLASTYYFSSSGGNTLNSQDVWSTAVPYLQSVDDHWSLDPTNPNSSWATTLSQAKVAQIFDVPAVNALHVTAQYTGGAMESVTAIDQDGQPHTITGKADQLRNLFGLKSDFVSAIDASYQ